MTIIQHMSGHTPGTFWTEEMQSIVPLMGPLHISLNAREDICEIYHPLMKHIYEQLFPGYQLAKKPKTVENNIAPRDNLWKVDAHPSKCNNLFQ